MLLGIVLVNWLKAPRDFLSLFLSSILADIYNNDLYHYFHIWENVFISFYWSNFDF